MPLHALYSAAPFMPCFMFLAIVASIDRHPHEPEFLEVKLLVETVALLPQSHLHIHLLSGRPLGSRTLIASPVTLSLPNFRPLRFSFFIVAF